MKGQVGYYAVIPADVRYDDSLTANAKLLYSEITALSNEKGFCWATNSYFAKLYGVDKSSISRWLLQLEDAGFIYRKVIKNKNNEIQKREIYLTHPIGKNEHTPTQNCPDPIGKNEHTPIGKNKRKNNISINNTKNNTNNKESVENIIKNYTDDIELIEALNGFKEMRVEIKSKLTPRGMKLALNKLEELSRNKEEQIKIVNQSTMNSWKSFYPIKKEKEREIKSEFDKYNFG